MTSSPSNINETISTLAVANELEGWYSTIQRSLGIVQTEELGLERLVSGVDNRQLPVHRWYNLKESFSAQLPTWIVERAKEKYKIPVTSVLDPFVGGGTTGVSLAQHGISVVGVEYNPFIHFVASTKSDYGKYNPVSLNQAISQLSFSGHRNRHAIPELSTLRNPDYFQPSDVQMLLEVISQIHNQPDIDTITKNFLLLGVAAAIDDIANLRKDGRALRYEAKPSRPTTELAIKNRWRNMIVDLNSICYTGGFTVQRGNAMHLEVLPTGAFDMILYSPPYLNNFDYSEIYKLELWLLGYLSSSTEWQSLRKLTIHSHPSVKFDRSNSLSTDSRTQDISVTLMNILNMISTADIKTQKSFREMVLGYFSDMFLSLCDQYRVLKPGGLAVYVVANSRHRLLPIATDILLANIAQRIGFEPLELIILKKRNGRTQQKQFLRETATILRKPYFS